MECERLRKKHKLPAAPGVAGGVAAAAARPGLQLTRPALSTPLTAAQAAASHKPRGQQPTLLPVSGEGASGSAGAGLLSGIGLLGSKSRRAAVT
jgi:hypothetical protein